MIKTKIIKDYLKNPIKNYLTFDIKYTKKELEYLDNLNIKKTITFNYFGNIDNIDDNKLNDFIKNIGNNQNIEILSNIVKKIIIKICVKLILNNITYNIYLISLGFVLTNLHNL